MMQKFCRKRQNATACCGKKEPNSDCELKMKYKEWQNVTIAIDSLDYGGSCSYKVEAKCGYPTIIVNDTNIDMVVTYKKKKWDDDDDYKPDRNDTLDDDESHEGRHKDGKTEYKMDKNEKHDNDTDKDECQKTKLYLTLTNLNNPTRAVTARALQAKEGGAPVFAENPVTAVLL
jgi:hypothetical protein